MACDASDARNIEHIKKYTRMPTTLVYMHSFDLIQVVLNTSNNNIVARTKLDLIILEIWWCGSSY